MKQVTILRLYLYSTFESRGWQMTLRAGKEKVIRRWMKCKHVNQKASHQGLKKQDESMWFKARRCFCKLSPQPGCSKPSAPTLRRQCQLNWSLAWGTSTMATPENSRNWLLIHSPNHPISQSCYVNDKTFHLPLKVPPVCSLSLGGVMSEAKTPTPTPPGDTYKGWVFKWTNYIKGYQRRWFVLSNGLLSYYRYTFPLNTGIV